VDANSRKRQRADLSFLSDVRLHCLLGRRRLSWTRRRCHRQLCRSEFPRADDRGVGRVTPPLALLTPRHAAQAHGEAGVTPAVGNVRFGSKADIARDQLNVRFTPKSGHSPLHSITSSAMASTSGGIVRPSAFAVFRLRTSSNFVGSCTGKSLGLVPLKILSI